MATIDAPEIVQNIIDHDGWYDGDRTEPRVVKVVSYLNQWGNTSQAIVYERDNYMRYEESPACRNVKVIWEAH